MVKDGIKRIFQKLNEVGYEKNTKMLSLHSVPVLAQFEKTYNQLTERLMESQRKLASLVFSETEKSQYRLLGRLSALIAHDLSGPLHASSFYVSELLKNPEHSNSRKYLERTADNLTRANELIVSLRAKIKNNSHISLGTNFKTSHQHVIRFLFLQFPKEEIDSVKVILDPSLDEINLKISSTDLVHILDNLYRNSIENLIKNEIVDPCLRISLQGQDQDQVQILIQDNGTGLSSEAFENLTADSILLENYQAKTSLGLRLTRRLIELNHGGLKVVTPKDTPGTSFVLELPGVNVMQQFAPKPVSGIEQCN